MTTTIPDATGYAVTRQRKPNTITFSHEVDGLALPLIVTAEFDAGDRSVGINPGWWLVEAELELGPSAMLGNARRAEFPNLASMLWDRDSFALMFGDEALRVAEDAASDHAYDESMPDRTEEE
jgi:hypothetical protein